MYMCAHMCVYTCKKVDIKSFIYIWRQNSTEYIYIRCIGYILIG